MPTEYLTSLSLPSQWRGRFLARARFYVNETAAPSRIAKKPKKNPKLTQNLTPKPTKTSLQTAQNPRKQRKRRIQTRQTAKNAYLTIDPYVLRRDQTNFSSKGPTRAGSPAPLVEAPSPAKLHFSCFFHFSWVFRPRNTAETLRNSNSLREMHVFRVSHRISTIFITKNKVDFRGGGGSRGFSVESQTKNLFNPKK